MGGKEVETIGIDNSLRSFAVKQAGGHLKSRGIFFSL